MSAETGEISVVCAQTRLVHFLLWCHKEPLRGMADTWPYTEHTRAGVCPYSVVAVGWWIPTPASSTRTLKSYESQQTEFPAETVAFMFYSFIGFRNGCAYYFFHDLPLLFFVYYVIFIWFTCFFTVKNALVYVNYTTSVRNHTVTFPYMYMNLEHIPSELTNSSPLIPSPSVPLFRSAPSFICIWQVMQTPIPRTDRPHWT